MTCAKCGQENAYAEAQRAERCQNCGEVVFRQREAVQPHAPLSLARIQRRSPLTRVLEF